MLARAQEEADRVLGADAPRFEHLRELGYIDQVLRESLRLWPTAPAYALYPKEDTTIGGRYGVEAGEELFVLLPMLHRDPTVWNDPERFDPERFAPEHIDQIPANAWKPFGRGQRACIGRPFAMQEAKLVLAMMLRRFDLVDVDDYQLDIKETLTLKPAALHIQAHPRSSAPSLRSSDAPLQAPRRRRQAPSPALQAPSAAAHGTPLLVLYGSNSGSAEAFARRIAGDAQARGWDAELAAMDDHVGDLPTGGALTVVTASYNGEPPDNARVFCEWLDGLEPGALDGVRYAVFGCGNRDWSATYQAVPRRVDEALSRAGAERLMERGEADARGDFFGDFDAWYEPVWPTLEDEFDVTVEAVDDGPLYEIERLDAAADPLVDAHGTRLATVLENRELVDMSSPLGRSKRHVELELPDGLSYEVGDYLAVLPENDPERVARAAERFGFELDELIRLSSARAETSALPTGRPIAVAELLGRYVELGQPATRRDLGRLAELTPCPPEKQRLQALANDPERYRAEVLDTNVSLLDLLEQTASCTLGFAEFLEMLPPMRPRQYSISSSPSVDDTRCALTVAVVNAPAWSGHGRYRGTCSNFLARRRPGEHVEVTVRPSGPDFHPPADSRTLAPFRGFLQERAARQEAGDDLGAAALFFGCDHPEVDFLYRDELAAFEEAGLVEVHPAFFKKPDGDITFVQHRLWAERDRVGALLDNGAHVYVCGDGQRMAPAVRDTLARIHQERTGCTDADAKAWLEALEADGRYVADVFG